MVRVVLSDARCERMRDVLPGKPVIAPRSNQKALRDYDKDIYKERNLVALWFQKLRQFRGIATRYERLALNDMTMLSLASILIWLK